MLALASLETSTSWKVTAVDPGAGWTSNTFNDSSFVAASQIGTTTLDGNSVANIWAPGDPAPSGVWLRGTISLEGRPATAVLDAFADDDVELFINGVRFVNDANSSPTTVTNIDVTSALTAGTNVIAAHVTNTGGDRGFAARLEIDTERPDAGDTLATALNTGVVPGMHIGGVTLASSADVDLYRVELLRTDSLRATASLDKAGGSLTLTILDSAGQTVATGSASGGQMVANAASLPAGTYYLRVGGTVSQKSWYRVGVDAGSGSTTRVIYVNDGSSSQDVYALATGDDSNDGLAPDRPKASLQSVLASYRIDGRTLVAIDTGDYGGTYGTSSYGTVAIGAEDEGGIYAGSAAGSRFTYGGTRFELTDSDLNTFYGLTFADSGWVSGTGIRIQPSSINSTDGTVIRGNTFLGTSTGISVTGGTGTLVTGNSFTGSAGGRYAAIDVSGAAQISVASNDIAGSRYGFINSSDVASATVRGNTIHDNTTGVAVIDWRNRSVVTTGNTFASNAVGYAGYSDVGGSSWDADLPNLFRNNDVGVQAYQGANVAFNRFDTNGVGVAVGDIWSDTGSIHHNVFVNNLRSAVEISNSRGRTVVSNTIITTSGVGVNVIGGSQNVALRNNIISTDSGTALSVATDSQQGFASDYNNLYRTPGGTGALVWWQKPFIDLFDWQVEADYDSHSIGFTAPDPLRDVPAFLNAAGGDYRLGASSTSIDAGNPADQFSFETGLNGGRIDLGAFGNTPLAAQSASRQIRLAYPEYYTDWPAAQGRSILWSTYDSTTADKQLGGFVRIELHKEGVGKVRDIATVQASAGAFGWSPQQSGITPSAADRYRIVLVAADDPTLTDRSRESFSVPALTASYFVDDASNSNDEFTPNAVGNNRNTGTTALDPKANLLPLLRSYDLGPSDTVQIDTGDYIHVRNVIISGEPGRGDDEGATFTGPTDPGKVARIDRANPYAGSTNIEVSDGDYVTIRNLTLTGANAGLWVHDSSDAFTLGRMTVTGNSGFGIRLENSGTSTLADVTATNNGGDGIAIDGTTGTLTMKRITATGNAATGISISGQAGGSLENFTVHDNGTGISVWNRSSESVFTIGSSDLALAKGSRVFANASTGISATGNVLVAGNTVFGSQTGISVGSGAVARNNVAFDNTTGISGGNSTIDGNRVYRNTTGISSYASAVTANTAYSNSTGIALNGWLAATTPTSNNLVYANTNAGILLSNVWRAGIAAYSIANNTIYQPVGTAVNVTNSSSDVNLVNNILWADAGYCIAVDANSQSGFASDYNLFWTTGSGKVGRWQGVDRPTLLAWKSATLGEGGSLVQDPLFVDAPNGDFHERSFYGSYHGGSFAPTLGQSGLPVAVTGSWVADPLVGFPAGVDRSPAIDRGNAATAFANEPASNGGFVNIGAFGNTSQASKSPTSYVLVTSPDGGESMPQRRSFPIRWRAESLGTGSVRIELLRTGTAEPVTVITDSTENDGEFAWTVPATIPVGDGYRIRVSRTDGGTLTDSSNGVFSIAPPINIFYVNDGTVATGDWTTAAGSNANDGLSPASPMASLSVLLATYHLGPGDIVRVDRGSYSLSRNIELSSDDSGVVLEGWVDPVDGSRKTVLDRGNTASGTAVFQFTGGDDITIRGFGITGAETGVFIAGDVDSDRVTVTGNEVFQNSTGISASSNYTTSDSLVVSNNDVWGNQSYGINTSGFLASAQPLITGNRVYANGSIGICASFGGGLVTSNTVWGQNTGIYLYDYNAVARNNVAFDNTTGISSYYGTVDGNRVYRNTTGISASSGSSVTGNTVYANSTGIALSSWRDATTPTSNNLVYANTNAGITLSNVYKSGTAYSIANNTIYQPVGTAVNVTSSSRNVRLVNNILWADAGYCIAVDASSQSGFASDYNLFWNTANGKIGQWEGIDFGSLVDWQFDVGLDAHSRFANPQLVDPDGADNVLGFSTAPVSGTSRVIDNGAAGFSTTGTWTAAAEGMGGGAVTADYVFTSTPTAVASWDFTGLEPGAFYEVAVTWPTSSGTSGSSPFRILAGGATVATVRMNQQSAPNDFTADGASWERLGTFYVSDSRLTVTLSNDQAYYGKVLADAVRLVKIEGDRGRDDTFTVAASSPTIDAGDPLSSSVGEPAPSGGRVNLGHTGNTLAAATSPSQLLQVLSPNGLEKVEVGSPVTIQFRSAGLAAAQPVALVNVGGGATGVWGGSAYTTGSQYTSTFSDPVNTTGVANPAPADVYRSYSYPSSGQSLGWQIPAADGAYTLRLHFVEPSYSSSYARTFDVRLQGTVVDDDFNLMATAGSTGKAVVREYAVTAAGGNGISLALEKAGEYIGGNYNYDPLLCGIELVRATPQGTASPTADVDVSLDNGATWTTIAAGVAIDRYGNGQATWTPSASTSGNTALVRVRSGGTSDVSDAAFLVANAGRDFYVNDGSRTGDGFTTAVGNNLNSGKSPDKPMKSLRGLLAAYNLDAGDVIHVDAGAYRLVRNIELSSDDSGVVLEGWVDPVDGSRKTVLDRGNTAYGTAVFQFTGADDVTIRGFGITGAETGILIVGDVDSDRVTVTGNEVFQNSTGISASSSNYTTSDSLVVSNNDVWGNQNDGIYTYNLPASVQPLITGNRVYANRSIGIYVSSGGLVTSNTVWGQNTGIYLYDYNAVARNNVAFDNTTGISSYYGTVDGNRVYRNTTGISASSGSSVTGNTVYANSTGIALSSWRDATTPTSNNLVYANTNAGITLSNVYKSGTAYSIANNTIYQPVGTAVNVANNSSDVQLVNNILWTDAGPCIAVDANSQTGFSSDYNLFWNTANGKPGSWSDSAQASLAAWRTASGEDAHSSFGNPLFVDIDGADDVLGYTTTGTGYDGGRDDNFYVRRLSPAIDAANSPAGPATDRYGQARVDDPGTTNTGIGIADIGAIEFLGSSLDTTPPTVTATFPAQIASSGVYGLTRRIDVTFSEGVNAIDALASGNYELVKAGSGGFGSPDDVFYTLTPSALTTVATGILAVRLDLGLAGASLPNGQYRFTVRGAASRAIHDAAGNTLDGNADGTAGGDWVRTFTVDQSISSSIDVPAGQTVTDSETRTGSYQLVKQGGGTLILDKANSHSGGTVVEAGTIIVKNASALGTGPVRIKAGATLVIDPSAGEVQAGSLAIEDGGFVDLGTGRVRIVSGMTASDLVTILLAARGDGTWTSTTGLGSSAVANAVANFEPRTLGWLDNGDGSFTVSYAAPGDTSLDGVVDITDVANFLGSGKMDSGEPATWDTGDFNLDGVVDQLDLADFLGAALYDAGPYLPGESTPAAASSPASQPPDAVALDTSESTAIQSAFAALANDTPTSSRDKQKLFATYR